MFIISIIPSLLTSTQSGQENGKPVLSGKSSKDGEYLLFITHFSESSEEAMVFLRGENLLGSKQLYGKIWGANVNQETLP